ncbi:ER membrane protein DP1/Yop1 [Mortierella sp. GBA35]|nr:ER membrane protein DP1/Yop1 [Mortierella sp. AD031]KAF9099007.1 ER membrane protein DP1/Yop1 [Mortierella sp. GBA35]KAG0218873.1 ER membrane protein DP1/Yop1 [Mortierella sp. NVP41]
MENILAKARYHNAQLDKELSKYQQLNQFQAATGVPKTYLALGAGAFFIVMIFFNFAGKLLSNILGWVYPAYRSFKALESPSHDDDKQWSVYGFVSILESFTDILLYWFPFYFFLKTVLLLWLMLPVFNGATTVYLRLLRPFLVQHHSQIDSHLDRVKAKVSAVASELDNTSSASH